MSRNEFIQKYRGRMLLFLTEAWAARKAEPSSLGLLLDDHARQLKGLLEEMHDALSPPTPPVPAQNGTAVTQGRKA